MADTDGVALPEFVTLDPNRMPRITPNMARAIRAETGRGVSELMGGDNGDGDDGDRFQLMVWLKLRAEGIVAPWDALGDVGIEFAEATEPDPTSAAPSTSSPGSAATGG